MADKIRTLGPGSLVIGAADDQRRLDVDCTSVELAPDNSSDDPDHLSGRASQEAGNTSTTWTMEGTIGDDFSAEGAAACGALDHAVERRPCRSSSYPTRPGAIQMDRRP